jgi:hypothetical protein
MGSAFGGFINSVTSPNVRTFGVARNLFIPWDMSKGPKDNSDKVKKYGSGDGSHAIAIKSFDYDGFKHGMKKADLADGFTGQYPTGTTSFALFDPAAWVLRMHEPEGKGKDNNWTVRLQTDHGESSQTRKHRSTIFVDNCDEQNWAWAQDLTWIIKTDTSISDAEIKFDKAGFLPQLKFKGKKGESTRGALALNVSKRGGFVTDGVKYGQLWHVLNLPSAGAAPTPPPGTTVVSGGGSGGTTVSGGGSTSSGSCANAVEGQLALRGDVLFDTKDGLAHLKLSGGGEPTNGKLLVGWLFVSGPGPSKPPVETARDASSNQKELNKKNPRGIWCWVKDDDMGVPADKGSWNPVGSGFPSLPGSTGETSDVERGVFHCKRFTDNGNPTGISASFVIPEEITGNLDWGFTLDVNFVTPSSGFSSTVDLQLDYCTMALGADASPASLTGTLAQTINAATHAGSEVVQRVLFFIPHADLQGKGGGKLAFAFYRRADTDGDGDKFDMVNVVANYGPEIVATTYGH